MQVANRKSRESGVDDAGNIWELTGAEVQPQSLLKLFQRLGLAETAGFFFRNEKLFVIQRSGGVNRNATFKEEENLGRGLEQLIGAHSVHLSTQLIQLSRQHRTRRGKRLPLAQYAVDEILVAAAAEGNSLCAIADRHP